MTLSCGLCCEFNRLRVALFVVSHFFLIRSADLQAESACSKPLKLLIITGCHLSIHVASTFWRKDKGEKYLW
ncbi:hypothetical protein EV018_09785 [Citrobacter freundii]|nr:hypothetical protein MC62_007235 [Citrobacter freundii]POU46172.1 hypothetical protein C3375_07895 [Citrobacter freundii complex sp. CFNIH12]POV59575.1 hypothetical protein C3404_21555 [Citrobacter freundii complex sp. CFNIH11]PSF22845.1 hypothetical protein C6985_09970 [Escherichia coli]RNL75884.1 hypothetical protein D7I40_01800 [Citrobacter sp. MH181794]RUR47206.1 hypothetical protein EKO26_08250 [Citrobacter portucalensis]RXM23200.1 hypothetical protein EO238_19310 [Citrobacter sp. AAK